MDQFFPSENFLQRKKRLIQQQQQKSCKQFQVDHKTQQTILKDSDLKQNQIQCSQLKQSNYTKAKKSNNDNQDQLTTKYTNSSSLQKDKITQSYQVLSNYGKKQEILSPEFNQLENNYVGQQKLKQDTLNLNKQQNDNGHLSKLINNKFMNSKETNNNDFIEKALKSSQKLEDLQISITNAQKQNNNEFNKLNEQNIVDQKHNYSYQNLDNISENDKYKNKYSHTQNKLYSQYKQYNNFNQNHEIEFQQLDKLLSQETIDDDGSLKISINKFSDKVGKFNNYF